MLENILYDEYTSAEDKSFMIEMEAADIKLDRLFNTLDAIMESHELNLREAELRCFEESGDMEDLETYYEEEAEKTTEQQKGIFAKIGVAIKAFFTKIKNFLFGKKEEIPAEGTSEAPKGLLGFIKNITSKLRGAMGAIKNAIAKHKIGALTGAIATAAVGALAFANRDKLKEILSGQKETIQNADAKKAADEGAKVSEEIENATDGMGDKPVDGESKTFFDKLRGIGKTLADAVAKLISHIGGKKKEDDAEGENTKGGNANSSGVQQKQNDLTGLTDKQAKKRLKEEEDDKQQKYKDAYEEYKKKCKEKGEKPLKYNYWRQSLRKEGQAGNKKGLDKFLKKDADRNSTTIRSDSEVNKDANKTGVVRMKSITPGQFYNLIKNKASTDEQKAMLQQYEKDFSKGKNETTKGGKTITTGQGKYRNKDDEFRKSYLKTMASKVGINFTYESEEDDEDDILNTMFGEAFDDDDFAETFDEAADEISDMLDELFFGAL